MDALQKRISLPFIIPRTNHSDTRKRLSFGDTERKMRSKEGVLGPLPRRIDDTDRDCRSCFVVLEGEEMGELP